MKEYSSEKSSFVTVILNFSGIYEEQDFSYIRDRCLLIEKDLTSLSGTNCYCDEEAWEALIKLTSKLPIKGIHFLDSGNYHYMTRVWLQHVGKPFRLLVFDNHTDLQAPMFEGLLSCGGWIRNAILELPELREIWLVGPDEASYSQVEEALQEKICYLSREKISQISKEEWCSYFEKLPMDLPWYLSIDKDILCKEDACTAWSQGELKLEWLLEALCVVQRSSRDHSTEISGIDICGEGNSHRQEDSLINQKTNHRLWEELSKFYA